MVKINYDEVGKVVEENDIVILTDRAFTPKEVRVLCDVVERLNRELNLEVMVLGLQLNNELK